MGGEGLRGGRGWGGGTEDLDGGRGWVGNGGVAGAAEGSVVRSGGITSVGFADHDVSGVA